LFGLRTRERRNPCSSDSVVCTCEACLSLRCALQIEMPVAIVDANIDKKTPEARRAAEAFIEFLFTPAAQHEFARCGLR
jgi:ABC-type sulfate transport system substrate-binding protein